MTVDSGSHKAPITATGAAPCTGSHWSAPPCDSSQTNMKIRPKYDITVTIMNHTVRVGRTQ